MEFNLDAENVETLETLGFDLDLIHKYVPLTFTPCYDARQYSKLSGCTVEKRFRSANDRPSKISVSRKIFDRTETWVLKCIL